MGDLPDLPELQEQNCIHDFHEESDHLIDHVQNTTFKIQKISYGENPIFKLEICGECQFHARFTNYIQQCHTLFRNRGTDLKKLTLCVEFSEETKILKKCKIYKKAYKLFKEYKTICMKFKMSYNSLTSNNLVVRKVTVTITGEFKIKD